MDPNKAFYGEPTTPEQSPTISNVSQKDLREEGHAPISPGPEFHPRINKIRSLRSSKKHRQKPYFAPPLGEKTCRRKAANVTESRLQQYDVPRISSETTGRDTESWFPCGQVRTTASDKVDEDKASNQRDTPQSNCMADYQPII